MREEIMKIRFIDLVLYNSCQNEIEVIRMIILSEISSSQSPIYQRQCNICSESAKVKQREFPKNALILAM